MEQQKQSAVATAQPQTVVAEGFRNLKFQLNRDVVRERFQSVLGKKSNTFIASLIDLCGNDDGLKKCEASDLIGQALKAAALDLPINKALGNAYIVAYKNYKTGRLEPSFQLGYKGYIQLALRTGQYRHINADVVYEGELKKVSKLTGEISFEGEKTSDRVVGYFAYIELLNGFSKTYYMTVEQAAQHAKRFSKGLGKEWTVAKLVELANVQISPDSNKLQSVGWTGNFHAMALKTVIRLLLSKYGYLSIEMASVVASDIESETAEDNREAIVRENSGVNRRTVDFGEEVSFEEAPSVPQSAQAAVEVDENPAILFITPATRGRE